MTRTKVKEVRMNALKRRRLLLGWSQSELARQAALNSATVCQIEAGRLKPYPSQLAKLARALGVPENPDSLLHDVHDKSL
jgi:transcriptional regulator with XRE-family HTH domain